MSARNAISDLPSLRCAHHPDADAGWHCAACGDLCPTCVARVRVDARTHYDTCAGCDGPVLPILVAGPAQPFGALLRSHLFGHVALRPLLYLCAAVSVWAELTLQIEQGSGGLGAFIGTALAAIALGTAFCAITVDTARGPDELVRSESLALFSEALRPSWPLWGLFGLLLAAPVFLPRWTGIPPQRWLWSGPLIALALGVGALLPSITIRQVTTALGGGPPRAFRFQAQAALLGALGMFLFHLFLWGSTTSANLSLWGWAEPLRIFAALAIGVLARVTGLFLHSVASEVGFPLPDRYRVPRMGSVVPTGTPAPKPPAAPPRSYEPIEL